jgi:S-adenosylmethionine decarboxylase
VAALSALFDAAVHELGLHPVGDAVWHRFPSPGGITGLWLLAESHLTVHTFPEFGSACVNLFCCTPREPWDWSLRLRELLGAEEVRVRSVSRAYAPSAAPVAAASAASAAASVAAASTAAASTAPVAAEVL